MSSTLHAHRIEGSSLGRLTILLGASLLGSAPACSPDQSDLISRDDPPLVAPPDAEAESEDAPGDRAEASDAGDEPKPEPDNCGTLAEAIGSKLSGVMCSTVVRLSYQTLDILGYTIYCAGQPMEEAAAREAASAAVGFPFTGPSLTDPTSGYPFVFAGQDGDHGAMAAVGGAAGHVVFGSKATWCGGPNQVVVPQTMSPPETLGWGCAEEPPGLNDWSGLEAAAWPQGFYSDSAAEAVLQVIRNTALPAGLRWKAWSTGHTLVLLDEPGCSASDNAPGSQWVVIINSSYPIN